MSWGYRELLVSAVLAGIALASLVSAFHGLPVHRSMFRVGSALLLLALALRPAVLFGRLGLRDLLTDGSVAGIGAWLLATLGMLSFIAGVVAAAFSVLTL